MSQVQRLVGVGAAILNHDERRTLVCSFHAEAVILVNGLQQLQPGSISNAVGGILRRGDRITISVTGTEDLEYEGIMFEDIYISKAMGDDGTEVTEDGTTSMFNIVMNQEDEQRLNEMISKGGTIRICKVNDVTF